MNMTPSNLRELANSMEMQAEAHGLSFDVNNPLNRAVVLSIVQCNEAAKQLRRFADMLDTATCAPIKGEE